MRLKKSDVKYNVNRSIQELEESIAELEMIENLQGDALNNEFVQVILKDAVEEAEATLKNSKLLISLYSKLDK